MIRKAYANAGSALYMFSLLSFFEVVISKAIEQYVCIIMIQVQKYTKYFKELGIFPNNYLPYLLFNISTYFLVPYIYNN